MGSFNLKNMSQLGIIVFAFTVVSLSFNNCGGVGSQSSTASVQMSYDAKVDALSKIHQGLLPTNFCADSHNYSCLHKVFSTDAQANASKKSEAVCTPLADGTELCPETSDFLFSTASAQENCQENCGGSAVNGFDSEEFECHVKLSLHADGIYPLVTNEKDFNLAVEKIYQSCLAIQKGNTQ